MKMIVFATINTANPDGYQILTCKAEDASWMMLKHDRKLAEIDVPTESSEFRFWLSSEGMGEIEAKRQQVVDSYVDAMNTLAEHEAKYLLLGDK